jgi:signal transduction histidine kinase
MTPVVTHGRVSRSVALRLAAGVLPSVLAVGLLIGLFYYGQFGRAIPELILIVASALTIASIVMAWVNAMYFADRLARLARATPQASSVGAPADEFDRIELAVGNLGSALTASEAARARLGAMAEARLHEQATILAGAVSDSISQLDQVRLPLQILLESPFGELNDNQEELLRDARAAADAIDVALRRLAQVADIDRGAFPVQHELVQVNDVVRSVLPLARAAAERNGARTETALEPGLPRVVGDRARLAEALSLLVTFAAARSDQNKPLVVSTAREGKRAVIRIAPRHGTVADAVPGSSAAESRPRAADGEGATHDALPVLASRLIEAQGGEAALADDTFEVRVG